MESEQDGVVVDEAALRREFEEMDVSSLLSRWDDPMPTAERGVLHAELTSRGVRVSSVDLPPTATQPVGSASTRSAKKIAGAVKWILAIGILQIVFGVGFGFMNNADVVAAEENLAEFSADETVVLEGGEEWIVGELREQLAKERISAFAVPIALGLAFIGLYFWGRRSPLPAMITALVLFVGVHALSAVVDPKTIMNGVVVKILFTVALVRGLKEILASQELNSGGASSGEATPQAPVDPA